MTDLERARAWLGPKARLTIESLARQFAAVRAEALEMALKIICDVASDMVVPNDYVAEEIHNRIRAIIPGGGRSVVCGRGHTASECDCEDPREVGYADRKEPGDG